jgi:hypothetical protein
MGNEHPDCRPYPYTLFDGIGPAPSLNAQDWHLVKFTWFAKTEIVLEILPSGQAKSSNGSVTNRNADVDRDREVEEETVQEEKSVVGNCKVFIIETKPLIIILRSLRHRPTCEVRLEIFTLYFVLGRRIA